MSAGSPPPSLLRSSWRALKISAATAFVVWQLFFLCFRNPLDFYYKPLHKWFGDRDFGDESEVVLKPLDNATHYYGDFVGIDQDWRMFTPPLAKEVSFLASRLEFSDGSEQLLLSENEPPDLKSYVRYGGWRQRKLEDQLVYHTPSRLAGDCERPLWSAFARRAVVRWRDAHPGDARGDPTRVVLERRSYRLPTPDDESFTVRGPEVNTVGEFNPAGELLQP
jgi:hypothetical protein